MKIIYQNYIAGVQFHAYALHPNLKPGLPLTLTWDRSNKYDENAIAVFSQDAHDLQLGFIKKADTDALHDLRKKGIPVHAEIVAVNLDKKTWERLELSILIPKNYDGDGKIDYERDFITFVPTGDDLEDVEKLEDMERPADNSDL